MSKPTDSSGVSSDEWLEQHANAFVTNVEWNEKRERQVHACALYLRSVRREIVDACAEIAKKEIRYWRERDASGQAAAENILFHIEKIPPSPFTSHTEEPT